MMARQETSSALTGRLWLARLSALIFLSLLPFSSYASLLPDIQQEWGLNHAQSAIVYSAYLVGYAASSLLVLPLTDRVRGSYVLIGGVAVAALTNIGFPFLASGFWSAAALRFVGGMGHVAVYVTGIQLVSRRFAGPRRGTAVAVYSSAAYGGTTLSYVVTAQFAARLATWQDAYFATALFSLAALALAVVPGGDIPAERASGPRARGRLNLAVLRHRPTALMIAAYSLHSAELYLARLWLPALLGAALLEAGRTTGNASNLGAALAGFMFTLAIPGAFFGGTFSDRIGRTAGAAIIFAASGACSLVIGWSLGLPIGFMIGLGFFYGFATAADSAIYLTSVTELAPAGRVGSSQAIQSFSGFSVGAIAPVVAGTLLDASASRLGWGLAFSFNAGLALVAVTVLLLVRRMPETRALAGGKR